MPAVRGHQRLGVRGHGIDQDRAQPRFPLLQIDLGVPVVREPYDKSQVIRFSAGTGL